MQTYMTNADKIREIHITADDNHGTASRKRGTSIMEESKENFKKIKSANQMMLDYFNKSFSGGQLVDGRFEQKYL